MKSLYGLMTFEHYLQGCKWECKKQCPKWYPSDSLRIWLIEFKPYVEAARPRMPKDGSLRRQWEWAFPRAWVSHNRKSSSFCPFRDLDYDVYLPTLTISENSYRVDDPGLVCKEQSQCTVLMQEEVFTAQGNESTATANLYRTWETTATSLRGSGWLQDLWFRFKKCPQKMKTKSTQHSSKDILLPQCPCAFPGVGNNL